MTAAVAMLVVTAPPSGGKGFPMAHERILMVLAMGDLLGVTDVGLVLAAPQTSASYQLYWP